MVLAKSIVDDGSYPGVAPLEGVTPTPVLRSDGSIVLQPGYDPYTRLFYAPGGPIPDVPAAPTRNDDAIDESGETHDRLVAFIAQSMMTESRSAWTASDLADALEGQGLYDLWGWGRQDANDLAAELAVWDRATRSVDRRRPGIELRSRLDRPASNGRWITCPRGPNGRPRRHRTNVSMYTLSDAQHGAGPT